MMKKMLMLENNNTLDIIKKIVYYKNISLEAQI